MNATELNEIGKKIEKEYLKESIKPDIWEIILLDPNLRCTCDEVIREEEIHHAEGHYHHCMLYQVARAVDISFRVATGEAFVFDESGKSGRFESNHTRSTELPKA